MEKPESGVAKLACAFSMSSGRAIALAILVALACGCAIQTYVEPTGEDIATWRVENESLFFLTVVAFKDPASCSGSALMNGGKTMAMATALVASIKPGDRFHFWLAGASSDLPMGYGETRHTCSIAGSFEPVRGAAYVARFASQGTKCHLQFAERFTGADGRPAYRQVASFRRNPECEPKVPGR